MVRPLPILRPDSGRHLAKSNPPLCPLQQTAETGSAAGLGPRSQSFLCSRNMDKDTKLAILSLREALRETNKSTSETRHLTLRIHDALVKAQIRRYPGAYESSFEHPLSEQTRVKNKLAHLVDAGIQALRDSC